MDHVALLLRHRPALVERISEGRRAAQRRWRKKGKDGLPVALDMAKKVELDS